MEAGTSLDTAFDVVVIGAGISGLASCARIIDKTPNLRILLVEATDRLGGRICGWSPPTKTVTQVDSTSTHVYHDLHSSNTPNESSSDSSCQKPNTESSFISDNHQGDLNKHTQSSTSRPTFDLGAAWIHGIHGNPLVAPDTIFVDKNHNRTSFFKYDKALNDTLPPPNSSCSTNDEQTVELSSPKLSLIPVSTTNPWLNPTPDRTEVVILLPESDKDTDTDTVSLPKGSTLSRSQAAICQQAWAQVRECIAERALCCSTYEDHITPLSDILNDVWHIAQSFSAFFPSNETPKSDYDQAVQISAENIGISHENDGISPENVGCNPNVLIDNHILQTNAEIIYSVLYWNVWNISCWMGCNLNDIQLAEMIESDVCGDFLGPHCLIQSNRTCTTSLISASKLSDKNINESYSNKIPIPFDSYWAAYSSTLPQGGATQIVHHLAQHIAYKTQKIRQGGTHHGVYMWLNHAAIDICPTLDNIQQTSNSLNVTGLTVNIKEILCHSSNAIFHSKPNLSEQSTRINASHVVITVPPTLLSRNIPCISPPLPETKQLAAKELKLGAYTKAILYFSDNMFWPKDAKPFWAFCHANTYINTISKDHNNQSLMSNSEIPFQLRYIENYWSLKGIPALVAVAVGEDAIKLEQANPQDAIKYIMQQVHAFVKAIRYNMHQDIHETMPNMPDAFTITQWSSNPWSLGAYSYIPVGCSYVNNEELRVPLQLCRINSNKSTTTSSDTTNSEIFEWQTYQSNHETMSNTGSQASNSISTLHFAGEATHEEYMGSLHAAWITGIQAGDEITAIYSGGNSS